MTEHDVDEVIAALRDRPHTEPPEASPRGKGWVVFVVASVCLCLVLQSVAVVLLTLGYSGRVRLTDEEEERDDCAQAYSAQITEAAAGSRFAMSGLLVVIGGAVRELIVDGEISSTTTERLDMAVRSSDAANAMDASAINQRNAWLALGSPLPCPMRRIAGPTPIPALDDMYPLEEPNEQPTRRTEPEPTSSSSDLPPDSSG